MVTRVARPGPGSDPAGEHLQLTTLAGWRGFVAEVPAVPDLLPEATWAALEDGKRACYDDDRIDHTTPGCWWSRPPRSARSSTPAAA